MLKLTILLFLVSIAFVKASEKCNIVNCFVDPCMIPNRGGCAAYPNAKCVSNYCNGCNYDWILNGQKVDCNKQKAPEGKGIFDGILSGLFGGALCNTVNCFVAPCAYAQCAVAGAVCRDNYCNGCNADWYLNGNKIQC